MMTTKSMLYYKKKDTRTTRRLKTGVEPIWFSIMPCASFYSGFRNILDISRMFQINLEYTWIS